MHKENLLHISFLMFFYAINFCNKILLIYEKFIYKFLVIFCFLINVTAVVKSKFFG